MPRKEQRDPSAGHTGFLKFLASQLTEKNYRSLTDDAFDTAVFPRHRMTGYNLNTAREIQRRLRDQLDGVLKGGVLVMSLGDALLIRLNDLLRNIPRRGELSFDLASGKASVQMKWDPQRRLQLCPHQMPGCRHYYVRHSGRSKSHCGNPACKNQHDKVRAQRTA